MRLADQHGAGVAQPAHDLGIPLGRVAMGERTVGGDLSRHVGFVLDRDRDAVQRRRAIAAARVGGVGGGERLVGQHDPVGAQVRVEPRDPLQVELGELACGHVAGADQLGLAGDTGEGELGCVHGAGPYR